MLKKGQKVYVVVGDDNGKYIWDNGDKINRVSVREEVVVSVNYDKKEDAYTYNTRGDGYISPGNIENCLLTTSPKLREFQPN